MNSFSHVRGRVYAEDVRSPVLPLALLSLCLAMPLNRSCSAQEMHDATASKPSAALEIRGLDGSTQTVTPSDLKALPHKSVKVFNAHTKKNESYSGVELAELLARVNAPVGEKLKGRLFMTGVVAEGTDGYKVLYSVAEVDPVMHSGDVIIADSVNGGPLGSNGAFQLVNTEDKRPARWVRNLDRILVVAVEAKE